MPDWTTQGGNRQQDPKDIGRILIACGIGAAVFLVGHYLLKIW